MFDEEDRETGYALFLAIGVAILVSLFTIAIAAGSAIGQFGRKPAAVAGGSPLVAVPAMPAASASATVSAVASARLYFELAKFDLPADARAQLAPLLAAARERSGATWVISGYHDASGDAVANAELAKQRAFAVRDLLLAAGVREGSIELAKPSVTLGGADPREARRVDVTLR